MTVLWSRVIPGPLEMRLGDLFLKVVLVFSSGVEARTPVPRGGGL